jgi:hypothetical protein
VEAKSALLVPFGAQDLEEVEGQPIDQIIFEGKFTHYRPIYQRVGEQTTKALYLAFDDAITVPFSSLLDGSKVVHVPVFEVADINRVAA